jgi:uncharacterized membrane protein YjjP (DUF1212 family)
MEYEYMVYLLPSALISGEIAKLLFGEGYQVIAVFIACIVYTIIYYIVKRRYHTKLVEIESMIDWV